MSDFERRRTERKERDLQMARAFLAGYNGGPIQFKLNPMIDFATPGAKSFLEAFVGNTHTIGSFSELIEDTAKIAPALGYTVTIVQEPDPRGGKDELAVCFWPRTVTLERPQKKA